MTANNRAEPQLMTMCVINKYIADYGFPPRVERLAKLRHMAINTIRMHMIYLERHGYIIHVGYTWQEIWVTEKGMNAA